MSERNEHVGLALSRTLKRLFDEKYYSNEIPSASDEALSNAIDSLRGLTGEEISRVSSLLDKEVVGVLGVYAERMAALVVRKNDIEVFKRALLALIVYASSQEPREVVLLLSVMVDSLKRINKQPPLVIEEALLSLGLGPFDWLQRFLNRNPKDQSIDVMGYEGVNGKSGFRYRRTW